MKLSSSYTRLNEIIGLFYKPPPVEISFYFMEVLSMKNFQITESFQIHPSIFIDAEYLATWLDVNVEVFKVGCFLLQAATLFTSKFYWAVLLNLSWVVSVDC